MNIHKRFGDRVRVMRERRGMTQRDLEEDAGISRTYLCRIERGDANVSLEMIEDLAEALECRIIDLMRNVDG